MPCYIQNLKPGTRFRLAGMPEVTGTLLRANDCRALVKLDRPERDVEFTGSDGETRRFHSRPYHTTSWAPTTLVTPVGFETIKHEETIDMATKSKSKKTNPKAPKSEKPAKAPKADKPAKEKKPREPKADGKLSALDAAAQVLADAKEPMNPKALIEAMEKKGLWKSPGGKTPEATLSAAMGTEINKKGKDSRFKKAGRGLFALA